MKIAMVGAGGIAARHLAALKTDGETEIVAHAARRPERAGAGAAHWGGRAYTASGQMLAEEEIEAVWICVPPGAHGPLEHDLIERDIPFFVEKPLDADCGMAEDIAEAVARRGTVTAVGYHWRALDTIPEVQAALAERPVRMAIGTWLTSTPPPVWWSDPLVGGGQLWSKRRTCSTSPASCWARERSSRA